MPFTATKTHTEKLPCICKQPVDLKAQLKKTKTVKREIEQSQLESVNLKEVPEDKKEEEERPKREELELGPPPTFPEVLEEKPKKKKKKAKPVTTTAATDEAAPQEHLRAEEKELASPEAEESPLPLEVNTTKSNRQHTLKTEQFCLLDLALYIQC